ncbi:MAG: hypothetical protein LBC68_02515 [Prevotellaceae bacterium]|jgi:hypothetical protein|nr:hypothetical protein [Prevotellaceae bacterium]
MEELKIKETWSVGTAVLKKRILNIYYVLGILGLVAGIIYIVIGGDLPILKRILIGLGFGLLGPIILMLSVIVMFAPFYLLIYVIKKHNLKSYSFILEDNEFIVKVNNKIKLNIVFSDIADVKTINRYINGFEVGQDLQIKYYKKKSAKKFSIPMDLFTTYEKECLKHICNKALNMRK